MIEKFKKKQVYKPIYSFRRDKEKKATNFVIFANFLQLDYLFFGL